MPPGAVRLPGKNFAHQSEQVFANLLDFYRIAWEYEPRNFPVQWDAEGRISESFTPDFYLPEFDLYVELTTMKQSLVTRKNRKIRLLRELYPHLNVQIFYQKDFENLIFKYGLAERPPRYEPGTQTTTTGHRTRPVHRRADRAAHPGSRRGDHRALPRASR